MLSCGVCEWGGSPRARPYRDQRVTPLLRGRGRVRLRLLALRLLAAAARRLLGPLLQAPLVQADRLPPLDLQLLGVGLLVPALAVDVVSPAALDPLPQPLHHRAVLSYAHRPAGHHAPGARVHAHTAVGSGSGGGEVPHHGVEWLLFWKNFSPRQARRHRRHLQRGSSTCLSSPAKGAKRPGSGQDTAAGSKRQPGEFKGLRAGQSERPGSFFPPRRCFQTQITPGPSGAGEKPGTGSDGGSRCRDANNDLAGNKQRYREGASTRRHSAVTDTRSVPRQGSGRGGGGGGSSSNSPLAVSTRRPRRKSLAA